MAARVAASGGAGGAVVGGTEDDDVVDGGAVVLVVDAVDVDDDVGTAVVDGAVVDARVDSVVTTRVVVGAADEGATVVAGLASSSPLHAAIAHPSAPTTHTASHLIRRCATGGDATRRTFRWRVTR